MTKVECNNCGNSFNDETTQNDADRVPCPICGSKLRLFKIELQGSFPSPRGGLRGVAYSISKTKWFTKIMSAPSFCKRLGVWAERLMVCDKKSDLYMEKITNPETEEVIHNCREPLTEHTGHGSARVKNDEIKI